MKTSQILLPLALTTPALSQGMVGWGWSIDGIPEDGLTDISFPMSIERSPHETRYYFANQFAFINGNGVGYTGLQPKEDINGSSTIRAIFSNFCDGATSDHENCHQGADGGAGVTCRLDTNAPFDTLYEMSVQNTGGTTWTGTLVDRINGNSTEVGRWTLPAGTGGIINSAWNLGFIEDYIGGVECNERHPAKVMVGDPTTASLLNYTSEIGDPYEYGPCPKKANFAEKRTASDDGWDLSIGW
ncbi:hypothetical protein FQN51_005276 [Onygenales sp. PD_10]|nr:hypothetical protein FQN51_005276 [Onygenales sp. PD_10]